MNFRSLFIKACLVMVYTSNSFSYYFKVAFGFQFDGESYGAVLDKMSGAGSAGKAVSDFLNKLGVQIEVGRNMYPV